MMRPDILQLLEWVDVNFIYSRSNITLYNEYIYILIYIPIVKWVEIQKMSESKSILSTGRKSGRIIYFRLVPT